MLGSLGRMRSIDPQWIRWWSFEGRKMTEAPDASRGFLNRSTAEQWGVLGQDSWWWESHRAARSAASDEGAPGDKQWFQTRRSFGRHQEHFNILQNPVWNLDRIRSTHFASRILLSTWYKEELCATWRAPKTELLFFFILAPCEGKQGKYEH